MNMCNNCIDFTRKLYIHVMRLGSSIIPWCLKNNLWTFVLHNGYWKCFNSLFSATFMSFSRFFFHIVIECNVWIGNILMFFLWIRHRFCRNYAFLLPFYVISLKVVICENAHLCLKFLILFISNGCCWLFENANLYVAACINLSEHMLPLS